MVPGCLGLKIKRAPFPRRNREGAGEKQTHDNEHLMLEVNFSNAKGVRRTIQKSAFLGKESIFFFLCSHVLFIFWFDS